MHSTLARNVLTALAQGSQIQCNIRQYPEIRASLFHAAEVCEENSVSAQLALAEIDRLDQTFNWNTFAE